MTTEVTAEFKDDEVKKFLDKLNKNLKAIDQSKYKKVVAGFATIVFGDIQKHFREAMGPKGQWDRWSDLYAERQKKLGKTWPSNALKFGGDLRQNFKVTSYRQTSEGTLWFNNAKTKSGFSYAAHHDELAKKPRPFMWLSKDGFDRIAQVAIDALVEKEWS